MHDTDRHEARAGIQRSGTGHGSRPNATDAGRPDAPEPTTERPVDQEGPVGPDGAQHPPTDRTADPATWEQEAQGDVSPREQSEATPRERSDPTGREHSDVSPQEHDEAIPTERAGSSGTGPDERPDPRVSTVPLDTEDGRQVVIEQQNAGPGQQVGAGEFKEPGTESHHKDPAEAAGEQERLEHQAPVHGPGTSTSAAGAGTTNSRRGAGEEGRR